MSSCPFRSVCLFLCHLSTCLSLKVSGSISLCLSFPLSSVCPLFLSLKVSVYLSVCLSFLLSPVCTSVCLLMCLAVYLGRSVYPSNCLTLFFLLVSVSVFPSVSYLPVYLSLKVSSCVSRRSVFPLVTCPSPVRHSRLWSW